jgi:hypothetical protein
MHANGVLFFQTLEKPARGPGCGFQTLETLNNLLAKAGEI